VTPITISAVIASSSHTIRICPLSSRTLITLSYLHIVMAMETRMLQLDVTR
jgi:hypothetical protein